MYPLEYNPVLSEAGHCKSRYAGFFRDYMGVSTPAVFRYAKC